MTPDDPTERVLALFEGLAGKGKGQEAIHGMKDLASAIESDNAQDLAVGSMNLIMFLLMLRQRETGKTAAQSLHDLREFLPVNEA